MVEHQLRRRGVHDRRVLDAMGQLPRHLFVPPTLTALAYNDTPLPIGHGQTISQPLMVALMLQYAELRGDERVLEVGAGSGYQAALLGLLAREVVAIEIDPMLAEGAKRVLAAVGARNVELIAGDGSSGYPPRAPFDAILVAAAAAEVPSALVEQLAEGGRLLLPVGPRMLQDLIRVRKREGRISRESLGACAFVPLVVGGASAELAPTLPPRW